MVATTDDQAAASGDSLDRYRRMRDFSRTPEPSGAPPARPEAGDRVFVVQRHRATARHYDFRLEVDGVLASWAVPKGPSLDPEVRRLAIHVEDHPMEYLHFEGVIPAKEYGGGDVIVWDTGTWEPGNNEDPATAIRAGTLHVILHGEKLLGEFMLVRTARQEGDKEQWLLFHKHDEHTVEGWDAEGFPRSVLSGRTNEEVLADPDEVWHSDRPADQAAESLRAAVPDPLTEDELSALRDLGSSGTWEVFGQQLRLTNLDKVLFPARQGEEPVTKREFIEYAEAGVHTATASRALSPRPETVRIVSPEKRERVLAAAERLGYHPNQQGRALRTGRSLVLGLLVPRISDTVLSAFYEGMLAEAQSSGYSVVVANTADEPERREGLIRELVEHGVDGVVYTDAHLGEPLPSDCDVPVLQAYRYSQPPGGVVVDDEAGGAAVAQHFADDGHQRIALLAGFPFASSTTQRSRGFLTELERRGVDRSQVVVVHGGLTAAEGRSIAESMLAAPDPPTAIFAVDDYLALGVASAVHRAGLTPGRHVCVVGYNDVPIARELPVPMSSVAVPLDILGAHAARSLLGVLEGKPAARESLRPELKVRESSLRADREPV